ncbi:hypothetical protein cypCar_00007967 [Cyprinus carpio]|nr:hypothetical protein cypCar_00007967 [Cyprinus carpio]
MGQIHGTVLTATVRCYEHKALQAEHRILVEVLNENDNKPEFLQRSVQPLQLSELTAVNSVVFTVQATDADGDTLTYVIDETSPDARYFRVDLPNSGKVVLNKPLDYEIKTQLQLTLYAVVTHTETHAAQTDDPLKYAVATVLVRVLAENRFPPQFSRSTYHGFVSERANPASLVMTYGNKLLILEATDQDFTEGFNPRLQYSLNSQHNSSQLFYITQEGLLIAKTSLLHPGHKYFLEVLATDLESGDTVKAALHVEVLQKGQPGTRKS